MLMKKLYIAILLSSSFTAFAQTGPGGVGNSSNNIIWLDANKLTGLNHGDLVTTWTDVSGNGNDFIQATAGYKPTYRTSSTFLSNVPHLQFQSKYMELGPTAALNSSQISSIVVCAPRTSNPTCAIMRSSYSSGAGAGSNQYWGHYFNGSGTPSHVSHTRNSAGIGIASTGTPYSTAKKIMGFNWNGVTGNFRGYENNNLLTNVNTATSTPSGHLLTRLGSNTTGGPGLLLDGFIAEVIVFNTQLNSAQNNIIQNYLSRKYNIAIANDYFAYDATHGYLIGVGQEADGASTSAKGDGILTLDAGTLNNGDYVIVGHNNTSLTNLSGNVPTQNPVITRITRTWRADITGSPGAVDLTFELNTTGLDPNTNYYLLLDADGDFSSGATSIAHSSYNGITNIVSFSGVTIPDGSYISIAAENKYIITKASGNWTNPATWNCNCVPGYGQSARILSGHTVNLNSINCYVDSLIIDAGGTLNSVVNSYFLNMQGNLYVNGSVNGTISLDCIGVNDPQVLNNNSGTPIDLYYFYGSNTSLVTFNNGDFNIHSRARNNNGFIEASPSANVTFVSNASYTCIIQPITTGFGFLGDFVMQRYIAASIDDWSDMASPVQFTTIADWDDELYMSGVFGNDGNAGPFKSVWQFDNPSQQFVAVTSTATPINPGYGIEMWLADTMGAWYGGTFDSRGTPNSGNLSIPSGNLGSTPGDWNLLGNPYQSWIKWNTVTKSNLKNEVWFYDHNISNYTLVSGSNVLIPASQGFWAENTGSTASATFTENSKNTVSSSSFFYRTGGLLSDSGEFVLKLKGLNAPYAHHAYFRLNENATESYNPELDARFLKSKNKQAHNITIKTKDHKVVSLKTVNPNQEITVAPLEIKVSENGIYQVDALHLDYVQDHFNCILLKNKTTGETIDIKATPYFTFEVTDINKTYPFELIFSNSLNACRTTSVTDNSSVTFTPIENNIVVKTDFADDENVYISVSNILGQEIVPAKAVNTSAKYHTITTEGLSGIYIITVKSSLGLHSQKIILY